MQADPTVSPSNCVTSSPPPSAPSSAFLLGRFVQALALAVAVAAVAMKLLQNELEMTFRYGGF